MLNILHHLSVTLVEFAYVRGLAFDSHVESTCMTASFHFHGRFWSIRLV